MFSPRARSDSSWPSILYAQGASPSPSPSPSPCSTDTTAYHAGASKLFVPPDHDGLVGFSAAIDYREVQLPCETQGATFPSGSGAWVGVTQVDTNNISTILRWAQMGYERQRDVGQTQPTNFVYTEVMNDYAKYKNGDLSQREKKRFPLPSGSPIAFRGELDRATGTWTFYLNGTNIYSHAYPGWVNQVANRVSYNGETKGDKTQLVGTVTDPCKWTVCRIATPSSNGFITPDLNSLDMFEENDIPGEWGTNYLSGDSIEMWDNHP